MKSKTTLSNNKWVKYITIGGIGLAFIGASYSLIKIWTQKRQLPKELVIKILQELRYEAFPIFFELVSICKKTEKKLDDLENGLKNGGKSNRVLIALIHVKNI